MSSFSENNSKAARIPITTTAITDKIGRALIEDAVDAGIAVGCVVTAGVDGCVDGIGAGVCVCALYDPAEEVGLGTLGVTLMWYAGVGSGEGGLRGDAWGETGK